MTGVSDAPGVHPRQADAAQAAPLDDLLAFPSDQFAPRLTRISNKHPIYVAEPSKSYDDWWNLYGEQMFHEWLERQV